MAVDILEQTGSLTSGAQHVNHIENVFKMKSIHIYIQHECEAFTGAS